MSSDVEKYQGGVEGGDSLASPKVKPPSRVDNLRSSVILLAYACELLVQALDEGPLRSKGLELCREASALAKKASRSRPQRQATRRPSAGNVVQRNHKRALAVSVRTRDSDSEG